MKARINCLVSSQSFPDIRSLNASNTENTVCSKFAFSRIALNTSYALACFCT